MVSLAHLVVRLGGALPRDETWPCFRTGRIALLLAPSASHDPFPPGLPIGYPALMFAVKDFGHAAGPVERGPEFKGAASRRQGGDDG